ncbi:unnamed protein product, partial [Didymodactylos carnosus]
EMQTPARTKVFVYLAEINDQIYVNIRLPQSKLENDLEQQSSTENLWTRVEDTTNTTIIVNNLLPYYDHDNGRMDHDQTRANIYMIDRRTNMLLDNLQAHNLLIKYRDDLPYFYPITEEETQHLLIQELPKTTTTSSHWFSFTLIILSILTGLCFIFILLWHCCLRPGTHCKYISSKPRLFGFEKLTENSSPLFDNTHKVPIPESPPFPVSNRAKKSLRTLPSLIANALSSTREETEPLLSDVSTDLLTEHKLVNEQTIPRQSKTHDGTMSTTRPTGDEGVVENGQNKENEAKDIFIHEN